MIIELYILSSPTIEIYPGDEFQVEIDLNAPVPGDSSNNHNLLINRNMEDQHSINSVTGLKNYVRKNALIFG